LNATLLRETDGSLQASAQVPAPSSPLKLLRAAS
jgi:hypothetical protein